MTVEHNTDIQLDVPDSTALAVMEMQNRADQLMEQAEYYRNIATGLLRDHAKVVTGRDDVRLEYDASARKLVVFNG